ncbi:MAG: protein-export chaperone SecB [Rikenellaceae bacterium]|nr:protein-export chaperone SecB [Rikenellaceae bacterium]
MKEAVFSLKSYNFPVVKMNFEDVKSGKNDIHIDILPEGEFSSANRTFKLSFRFTASFDKTLISPCIEIKCVGVFEFNDTDSVEDIPSYFYANSIAILFPYVRAFVSMVTLQANFQPVVLPTMNLSDLSNVLKEHVKTVE